MKNFVVLCSMFLLASPLLAQTEVKQHTVSIDSATGKRTVSTDSIVKTEEDITPYANMVNINPLKFLLAYNLNWVHKVSSSTAFSIGAELGTNLGSEPSFGTAWGLLSEYRFYPGGKSMHGFYVAPDISYTQTTNVYYYTYDPNTQVSSQGTYTAQMLSVGVLAGWQWFPGTDFSMGLALGIDDYIPLGTQHDNEDFNLLGGLYGKGTSPTLRFDIGYAWK